MEVVSSEELASRPGVSGAEPTHVLIETAPVGLSGYQADDWLREKRQIDVDLADHRRIMPLITFAHGEPEIDRLVRALRDLVDERGDSAARARDSVPRFPGSELRTEPAMLPRDAFFARTQSVKPGEAVGRVCAELITPYPAIAPGELFSAALVDYLEGFVEDGGFVEGAADPTLERMRVVADAPGAST